MGFPDLKQCHTVTITRIHAYQTQFYPRRIRAIVTESLTVPPVPVVVTEAVRLEMSNSEFQSTQTIVTGPYGSSGDRTRNPAFQMSISLVLY